MWNDVLNRARARRQLTPDGSGVVAPGAPDMTSPGYGATGTNYGTVTGVQGAQDALTASNLAYGDRGTQDYLNRAENFNASTALNKYAGGAWNTISAGLKQTLADEEGKSVGAGRFDSGFMDEDKGVLINRATGQLADSIAQQSVAAAGLDQRNTESLGAFGNERAQQGTDLLMSRSEQVQNDAREEAERRRRRRGGIAGAIGGALGAAGGFLVGGPVGASAGWKLGSGVGSAVGG